MIRKELADLAVPIDSIKPHPRNVRQGDIGAISGSLQQHGQYRPIVVQKSTGLILAGNHTYKAAKALGWKEVAATFVDCDDEQALRILLVDNRANDLATYDDSALSEMLKELLETDLGLDGTGFDPDDLDDLLTLLDTASPVEGDPDAVPDDAPAITVPGDVWLLGRHRVMCGDSTSPSDVAKLMNGNKAVLVHADPPYGMGKEKDGVLNDNLYADKLDQFQTAWWAASRPFVEDNGSAYVWGNAPDLWRWWYSTLSKTERLTMRNEIVWDKGFAQQFAQMTEGNSVLRSFNVITERCLFFMLGEQGFNSNADNYWEGFEPIRTYLLSERDKLKWTNKIVAGFFGFHPRMADHWFSKSQWSMPQKEQYERLQSEAKGKAFARDYDNLKHEYDDLKREYDDLKQAWYETRAYFDNTHDNMTDVWNYPRVTGADRHGHATPKPVQMIERCIKSSAPPNTTVLEPFGGSGSTLIAAEQTGRTAYLMELDPHYVDVICKRYQQATGTKPIAESTGREHDFT